MYDGHCRKLDPKSSKEKAQSESHVIRLKVPQNQTITFTDAIRGDISFESNIVDDQVILKSDGYPTYHLANVVDDHFLKISHVLRGEEWISSTPRHILIYEALAWEPPCFAHMPVILAQDGGKLSKRKGAVSVLDYEKAGYLPEALFNFLALLGWAPGDDRELMSREEIIDSFSIERITPKASVFDEKKLEWMNGHYMRERSVESIIEGVVSMWKEMGLIEESRRSDEPYFHTVVGLLKDRSKRVVDIAGVSSYFFVDPDDYEGKAAKKYFKEDALIILETLVERFESAESFDHDSIESIYKDYAEESGLSAGKLIHPTRLAVSGISFGPGLFELLEALGKETVIRRMKAAINWIKTKKE